MKYLYALFLLLIFSIFSCRQPDNCSHGEKAKFTFGLSYCNPIIELENGDHLEVQNMKDFDIEPTLGKEVLIKYHPLEAAGSYCQMGLVVELDCVVER